MSTDYVESEDLDLLGSRSRTIKMVSGEFITTLFDEPAPIAVAASRVDEFAYSIPDMSAVFGADSGSSADHSDEVQDTQEPLLGEDFDIENVSFPEFRH